MSKFKNIKVNHALVGLSLFLGALLMVTGIVNGNMAAVPKNLKFDSQQTVSFSDVDILKSKFKNKLKIVEFTSNEGCLNTFENLKFQKCYPISQLENLKWIRKSFSSVKRPVVIYAQMEQDRDYAASVLSYFGYNVQVLTDDASNSEIIRQLKAPKQFAENNEEYIEELRFRKTRKSRKTRM